MTPQVSERSHGAHSLRCRAGRHAFRHCGCVWAVFERDSCRQGNQRYSPQGDFATIGDQISALYRGWPIQGARRSGVRARCIREEFGEAWCGLHRPLLPASRGYRSAYRNYGGSDEGAREAREGEVSWAV